MKLTRNLYIYIVLITFASIVFIYTLVNDIGIKQISDNPPTYETSTPFIYGLFCVLSTVILYKTDNARNSRLNLGFTYHLIGSAVVLLLIILPAIFSDAFRGPETFILPAVIAVVLLAHWISTRKDLKGIESKKAFK